MAAINFPSSPAAGATYSAAGKTWRFNGVAWRLQPITNTPGISADGRVLTYSDLASVTPSAGLTYLVEGDAQFYIYDATLGWPAQGDGIPLYVRNDDLKVDITTNADNILRGQAFVYGSEPRSTTTNGRDYPRIIDGSTSSSTYLEMAGGGADKFVVVCIPFARLMNNIRVHHYYTDGRTYHKTKTEISLNGVDWTTVFDSAVSGEYAETSGGHLITFSAQYVRYIRDTINGSTANTGNHWVQIQGLYVP